VALKSLAFGHKMDETLKKVLKKITPTEEEYKIEKKIVELFSKKIKKFNVNPLLVGSLAKGTDLRGDKDIDIFVIFPKEVDREQLEKKGLEIGTKIFKDLKIRYEIDYAEHPYVKGNYKGYDIEIVPCYYDTKLEMKSSVDRTPFHTKYVRKKIRENKKLIDEIRLLKQFMKSQNVYGAEAKVEGFSGYLTEILVIHYGSFLDVLKAASNWHFSEIIDLESQWDDNESLKYFFTNASLIVIDPVDKDRNISAAVSRQKLAEFIIAAKEFLKNPDEEFFFKREERVPDKKEIIKRIQKRGTKIIAISFEHKKINENTLYSQLKKTVASVQDHIEEFDFKILKSGYWTNEKNLSVLLYEFEVWSLPKIKHHVGPPIDIEPENQEKFLEKYREDIPYIKDDHWVVDTGRECKKIEDVLPIVLKERKGFGKDLKEVKKIYYVEGVNILRINGKEFLKFLGRFL